MNQNKTKQNKHIHLCFVCHKLWIRLYKLDINSIQWTSPSAHWSSDFCAFWTYVVVAAAVAVTVVAVAAIAAAAAAAVAFSLYFCPPHQWLFIKTHNVTKYSPSFPFHVISCCGFRAKCGCVTHTHMLASVQQYTIPNAIEISCFLVTFSFFF